MGGLVSSRSPVVRRIRSPREEPSWHEAIAGTDLTIGDAMRLVDRAGIALVVDGDGRLAGTVGDSEIRRALLAGAPRHVSAFPFMNTNPATATPMPVVDADRRVVGLRAGARPAVADRPVVLMAGGRGARLGPLTAQCPKPLLRVGGRPLLEIAIERLAAQGFRRLVLCVGYRAAMIERHFGDGRRFGVEISYVRDDGTLGTAGPLALLDTRPAASFVVMNADLMTAAPIDRLLAFHDQSGADATMAVCEAEIENPYGVVQIDGARVAAVQEKPVQRCFVNAGIYAIDPSVMDAIARGVRRDMPDVLQEVIAGGGQVGAFPLHERWIDIGSHRDFEHAAARIDDSVS